MKNLKALRESWASLQILQANFSAPQGRLVPREEQERQLEQVRLLKLALSQRLITKN